jgi:hypothetical protein
VKLQEQETIEGVDNAIVVLGDCENLQTGGNTGFVFSLVKTLDKPTLATTIAEGVQK